MSDQTSPPEPIESSGIQNVSGGVTVQPGGDVNIGGDVVGRDKVTQTTVTNVGMSPEAVRKLIITVGVLVFVTAFCFFLFGTVTAAAALGAFARPVPSNPVAAADFQRGLNQVEALAPGEAFVWKYEEVDLSSYVRFVLGPKVGMGNDGKARLLSSQQVSFKGPWSGVDGRQIMLITNLQINAPQLYTLDKAYMQILPLGDNLGWVPVSASTVQPLLDQINADIGTGFAARQVQYPPFSADGSPLGPLTISGVSIAKGIAP